MTRTTVDIINDLDDAATDQDLLDCMTQTGLVVGFKHECRIVFHGQPDRLDKLNTLVRDWGLPLGFIKIIKIGKDVEFLSKPLIEFKNNPETKKILTELCTGLGKTLAFGDKWT